MRNFITAIAIALLAVVAPVKAMAKGKRQQQDAPKAEDQAKKKAAETGKVIGRVNHVRLGRLLSGGIQRPSPDKR